MKAAPKKILYIVQHAPYGSARAREALDVVFASAAFEQIIKLLFIDDGLWQLLPGQNGADIDSKDIHSMLGALTYYDVEDVFVDSVSLLARGLNVEQLTLPATAISTQAIRDMVRDADFVVSL